MKIQIELMYLPRTFWRNFFGSKKNLVKWWHVITKQKVHMTVQSAEWLGAAAAPASGDQFARMYT